MKVYFDNAATTPMAPEVITFMAEHMNNLFGNPSSVHGFGRPVRSAIEKARKKIASYVNAQPGEIFFMSGGTEADNFVLIQSVLSLGIKRIITSPIEHHAVEHTVRYIERMGWAKAEWLSVDEKGNISLAELEEKLKSGPLALVSLMHANNEIATMLPLEEAALLCKKYQALFHSDTVQTMGHYTFDLQKIPVDFITASAHKFHGPKGVGFLFVRKGIGLQPFIHGGSQERNMRGGTENVLGILGMEKAMDLAYENLTQHREHILSLKHGMMKGLLEKIPQVRFNGETDPGRSLYTVLNVSLPTEKLDQEMFLFNLDIAGIAASAGSACSSGSQTGSHVLSAIGIPQGYVPVRFSFSRYNNAEEVEYVINKIVEILKINTANVEPSAPKS
ncbi:MAG: cysteine desulfurase [Bacteroidia bacterium]|nr:cysteine desulfurase [Bacteroidia bacterium]